MTHETAKRHRLIAYWLLTVCAMVYAMVVLGGITRLTHSGLSMVEWKPLTGWLPPFDETQWREMFAKYQQSPEYNQHNVGMTQGEFKSIFWLEFLHRLWGRLIGVAFFVPFVFFLLRGWVNKPLAIKLGVMFILGAMQGVLGWYMVKSGLTERADVSQYRLTAHLGAALIVYGYMLWVALGLLSPRLDVDKNNVNSRVTSRAIGRFACILPGLVFFTALSGGFVAGLDAGFVYNTFPLMDGKLLPEGLLDMSPLYINFFENITTVQFDHRLFAESVFVLVIILWLQLRHVSLPPRPRLAVNALLAMVILQVGLGISTLLMMVPTPLASLHQAGGVALFSVALWVAYELASTQRTTTKPL